MFKKDVVKELGYFNPDLVQICDLEYFLRIATNYGIKYVPRPLTYFRVHKGSASTSNVSERLFSMMNIDPIILVHQFLYESFFLPFRQSLSIFQKMKLRLYFRLHVNEAYINSLDSGPVNTAKFEMAGKKYPEIATFRKGTIVIWSILIFLKIKRIIIK
jgi:hypothetical protein